MNRSELLRRAIILFLSVTVGVLISSVGHAAQWDEYYTAYRWEQYPGSTRTPMNANAQNNQRALNLLTSDPSVIDKDLTTAPVSPAHRDKYIVAGIGGEWAACTVDDFAIYDVNTWICLTPPEGFKVNVEDESAEYRYSGSAWVIWNNQTTTTTSAPTFLNQNISGAAGTGRNLFFNTGSSNRWLFGANNQAETGSNAGSDFQLQRRADDGSYLGAPMLIRRSDGRVTFENQVVIPTLTNTYNQGHASALSRDLITKLKNESVSILDFIPEIAHAAIKAGTSTYDVSTYIQNAFNQIDFSSLYFPSGRYWIANTVIFTGTGQEHFTIFGDGEGSTKIASDQNIPYFQIGTFEYDTHGDDLYGELSGTNKAVQFIDIHGLGFWNTAGPLSIARGILLKGTVLSNLHDLYFYDLRDGIYASDSSNFTTLSNIGGIGHNNSTDSIITIDGDATWSLHTTGFTISSVIGLGFDVAAVRAKGLTVGDLIINGVNSAGNVTGASGVLLDCSAATIYSDNMGVYVVDHDGLGTAVVRNIDCDGVTVAGLTQGGNITYKYYETGTVTDRTVFDTMADFHDYVAAETTTSGSDEILFYDVSAADYRRMTRTDFLNGHEVDHITGGGDEIDGDKLDIDWTPTNYTPATTPSETSSVDNLTAHLYGIDQALGVGGGAVSSVFGRTGAVTAESNDYTWAQINKTISSLADLATRSAGDLSSGNLGAERLPIGGNWSLSADLNLDSNTFVLDYMNNRVGLGDATPDAIIEAEPPGTITVPIMKLTGTDSNNSNGFNLEVKGHNGGASLGAQHVQIGTNATSERLTLIAAEDSDQAPKLSMTGSEDPGTADASVFLDFGSNRFLKESAVASLRWVKPAYINYKSEVSAFTTVGQTITGGTSGATGILIAATDNGSTGLLYLKDVSGTFQNNEALAGSSEGSATADNGLVNYSTPTVLQATATGAKADNLSAIITNGNLNLSGNGTGKVNINDGLIVAGTFEVDETDGTVSAKVKELVDPDGATFDASQIMGIVNNDGMTVDSTYNYPAVTSADVGACMLFIHTEEVAAGVDTFLKAPTGVKFILNNTTGTDAQYICLPGTADQEKGVELGCCVLTSDGDVDIFCKTPDGWIHDDDNTTCDGS